MERKEEALITQSVVSTKKTIYVEGNLDLKTIRCFLDSKKITNVKVVEINIEIDESHIPVAERQTSKEKLINLIEKANNDTSVNSQYIGIVDLDYDYFTNNIKTLNNLLYTDLNSIESYFLDYKLINLLLSDYNVPELDEVKFNKWKDSSLNFSLYFYFQITNIIDIGVEDSINFSELGLCNNYFTNFEKKRINLKNIISAKTKNKEEMIAKFITFFFKEDRNKIYSNMNLFLHGKHTLKYIICILKRMNKKIQYLSEETIINTLKDKFIINNLYNYTLFDRLLQFADN